MPISKKAPPTTDDKVKVAAPVVAKKAVKKTTKAVKKTTKRATQIATEPATEVSKTAPSARKASARKATTPASTKSSPSPTEKVTLRGRSVFLVQTTSAGVTVRTAWLSEDKSLREMAAVFPDVNYAIHLIDDLKREVLKHFSQAAKVGVQAIASQRNNKLTKK